MRDKKRKSFSNTAVSLKILLLLSVLLFIMLLVRVYYTERTSYLFLLWNLFLAWIPLMLAVLIEHIYSVKIGYKRLLIIITGLLWLFFYPNAPYMITDYIHLSQYTFMSIKEHHYLFNTYVFHTDLLMWYDFILLSLSIGISLLLGFIALFELHEIVKKHFNYKIGWGFVGIILFLTSIAIYIGRFLRFNSWDIFTDPFGVILIFTNNLKLESFIFVLLFFILLKGFYVLLYSITSLSKK